MEVKTYPTMEIWTDRELTDEEYNRIAEQYKKALIESSKQLCDEALDKFDWSKYLSKI